MIFTENSFEILKKSMQNVLPKIKSEDLNLMSKNILNFLENDEGLKILINKEDINNCNALFTDGVSHFNIVIKNESNNEIVCLMHIGNLWNSVNPVFCDTSEVGYGIGEIIKKGSNLSVSIFNNTFKNHDYSMLQKTANVINDLTNKMKLKSFPFEMKKINLEDLKNFKISELLVQVIDVPYVVYEIPLINERECHEYFYCLFEGYFKTININNKDELIEYIKFIYKIHDDVTCVTEQKTSLVMREILQFGEEKLAPRNSYTDFCHQINLVFRNDLFPNKKLFLRIKLSPDCVGKSLKELPLSLHMQDGEYLSKLLGENLYLDIFLNNKDYYHGLILMNAY